MDRRTYLASTGAVLGGSLAGCLGNAGSDSSGDGADDERAGAQTGVLSTAVSDDPADIGDFERLVVTIDEVWVHPAGSDEEGDETTDEGGDEGSDEGSDEPKEGEDGAGEGGEDAEEDEGDENEEEGGKGEAEGDEDGEEKEGEEGDGKTHDESAEPIRIDVDGAEADLVELQGDAQQVIDSTEIDVGTYGQIKLWVEDDVDAVLTDGSEADVMTPGNAPLKFNEEFEIRPNTETTFTADFAPHKRGPNGYVLKPVATEVRVEYNELSAEGGSDGGNETAAGNESSTSDESAANNESEA